MADEIELRKRLAAIDEAIGAGVARVDYQGFGAITYKNMDEPKAARRDIKDQLRATSGAQRPRLLKAVVRDAL